MDVATVARRAQGENFLVASLLFPRSLRPHIRALYCYARLVDMLGDEVEGDRLAALDELEHEVEACYSGAPTWPVMVELQPTIRAFDLPHEPFLRLIEARTKMANRRAFLLAAPGLETRRALQISGLDRHFSVHDTLDEALQASL